MYIYKKILILLSLLFLISCSASYEKLSDFSFEEKDILSRHIFEAYKNKADFEALNMHDWNSAKLYSEKAIKAANGEEIYPEKISYWNISIEKRLELIKAYNNLMTVYESAILLDPFNLAKAISSLDCWSEQQEENWQIWDINKCRDDYLSAMHNIYDIISENDKVKKNRILNNNTNNNASIVTKDNKNNILQIVYFDFDQSNLTETSIKEIKNFIDSNNDIIKKYIITGHTDTVGTTQYNYNLSLKRANTVKKILTDLNIISDNIKILGRGEDDLNVQTSDEISHPANRRAEIGPIN